MASTEGFFALCIHHYRAHDETHLNVAPGRLVVVWRVEAGWAAVVDFEGGWAWGWVPFGYVRPIDDETVGILEPIAQQLRLGALLLVNNIRATTNDHLEDSSADSNESDILGDESNIPRQRRSSRAVTRPRDMDTTRLGSTTPRVSLDQGALPAGGVQFAAGSGSGSPPSSSFVPSRVRAFRLRSKSRDGIRSDSESTNRSRRPSVSIRRTRVSMFGSPREPNPVEQIKRLDARPWYLKPAHSSATGDIVLDPDGSVRAGTLQAIVERLTCEAPTRSQELALRRDILFTYEAFTTSQQLFDLITDQYSLEPPRKLDESQFLDWKENRLRPTQARVLDVLGAWLDLPRLYQDDPELIPRMREFLKFVTKPEALASEARRHLSTIEQLTSPFNQHPPTPQRRRRRSEKQRPFPTLSSSPSGTRTHSHSFSGLLLSPTSPSIRSESPRPGPEHTSSSRGFASPVQRSTSPRLGFNSPVSRAASPSLHDANLRPGSPSISSTSMTSLPSALAKQQQQELGSGLSRAKSQRHASASYPRSESRQTDALDHDSNSKLPSLVNDLDPTALAHHLTLLESGLYMRIKRKQVLEWHKASSGSVEEPTINDLRVFCATSDRLAGWVKWSVLSMGSSAKRADAVGTWIRVAEKCRLLNNISSLAAIAAGLSSADISRLPHTWHLVPSARSQRLEDLVLLTSPAGGFAQLKILYSNVKFAVPFLGMYLTAIVHTADQFKDHVPFFIPVDKSPRDDDGWTDIGGSEPATPSQTQTQTQTRSRSKATRRSMGSPLSLSVSPASSALHTSPSHTASRIPSEPPTPTLSVPPSSPTTSTLSQPKLINFAKRRKQAEIIHAMLKFQNYPYTVSSQSEPWTSSSYPHTNFPSASASTSSSVTLIASAGGVAWLEEQLSRAAQLTLGTDWPYERSLKLYNDETMGRARSVDRENMSAAGF
ncbi:RasGEF domain-containing serine/threonine-protein kinase X [Rhizoctonia solani]|uniref:RasGEF domain-containing serine/threonine-protein kinase X n=1 Tax=Rhizoctonia solani TaxID=456999 RepID=A0A0K6FMH5_9AGAM|nr:RasGEF domain-containing serine/threonine-protein kinase X [Rhizoctonia solani]